MAEDDTQCGYAAICPVCGADVICCDEDPKHSGKHACEKGHEWTWRKKVYWKSVFKEGPKRQLGPN